MSVQSTESLCVNAGIRWHEADSAASLARQLATHIAQALQAQIAEDGQASLVVSGGSTPKPVFELLSQEDIDWAKVCVTLADERWVPLGHADSNESLVRDTLLVGSAAKARFVSLYRDGLSPEAAVASVAREVQQMPSPFTVAVLGMGSDGHTASLFPDAPAEQLRDAMDLSKENQVAILVPPSVGQVRISLTRSMLLNSRERILHITGEEKRQVLAEALIQSQGDDQVLGEYTHGFKPIVGLLTSLPNRASVFWSQ